MDDSSTATSSSSHLVLRHDARSALNQLRKTPAKDVQSISVELDGCVTDQECIAVFRSLARRPILQRLCVKGLKHPLPIQALSVVVKDPSSRLCHLTLENVKLSGKVGDYMELVGSLRLCSLQSIQMDQCEFADKHISLDPLIRAFSTISTLERLSLSGTQIAPAGGSSVWKCQCLQLLLPQLRALTLKEMPEIQQEQIGCLAAALEDTSCALKELTIQNQSSLKRQSIHRLAAMLQKNQSLEEFTFGASCKEEVVVIVKALQKRPVGLKRLCFPGDWGQQHEDFYSDTRHALLETVQANPALICLDLGQEACELSIEMNKYTNMNLSYQRSICTTARE